MISGRQGMGVAVLGEWLPRSTTKTRHQPMEKEKS
jgi:hypothetical protein